MPRKQTIDPRIGQLNSDGEGGRSWPALSLSGQSYTRPAAVRKIGGGRFVVLDNGLSQAEEERLIGELSSGTSETVRPSVDE